MELVNKVLKGLEWADFCVNLISVSGRVTSVDIVYEPTRSPLHIGFACESCIITDN